MSEPSDYSHSILFSLTNRALHIGRADYGHVSDQGERAKSAVIHGGNDDQMPSVGVNFPMLLAKLLRLGEPLAAPFRIIFQLPYASRQITRSMVDR